MRFFFYIKISRNPSKDANHLSEISAYWHSHVIIRRGLALESAVQTSFSGLFNT